MPKYPHISVQLSGEDGNAFAIIARVGQAMRRGGVPLQEVRAFQLEAFDSGSYDAVLRFCMATVDCA